MTAGEVIPLMTERTKMTYVRRRVIIHSRGFALPLLTGREASSNHATAKYRTPFAEKCLDAPQPGKFLCFSVVMCAEERRVLPFDTQRSLSIYLQREHSET